MLTQERITARIQELQAELCKGEVQLRKAEAAVEQIRDSMLRIHGAEQVLKELQVVDPSPGARELA